MLLVTQLHAQSKYDSLKVKLRNDSLKIFKPRIFRLQIALDNRNTFIRKEPVDMRGFAVGFMLFDRFKYGIGLYSIHNIYKGISNVKGIEVFGIRDLRMNYVTWYFDYVFINRRFWEISLPTEAGVGNYNLVIRHSENDTLISRRSGGVSTVGIALDVTFKPLKYFGLNAMGGLRKTFEKDQYLNFDGAFYALGIKFYLRETQRDIRYAIKKRKYKKALKN